MATDDLTTFTNVQTFTGAADADEAYVGSLITAASKWANRYTSIKLASRSYTGEDEDTLYDGDGTREVMLRNTPVTEITSVHESSDRTYDSTTLVDSDDYIFYPDTGRLVFTETIPARGWQTIKVLYTAGYDPVPGDLENAIIMLVDYWFKAYQSHRFGVQSVGVDDQRIVYEKGVPAQVKEALNHYAKAVLF